MAGFGRIILQFCAIFTSKGHVLANFPTTYYVHSNGIPIKSTNQQNWEYIQEMVMDLSGRWSVITAELFPSFHLLESTSPEQAKVSGISAVTFLSGTKHPQFLRSFIHCLESLYPECQQYVRSLVSRKNASLPTT